jgi:hypothetical protein
MNSNIQMNRNKTQDTRVTNMYLLMKQINSSVTIDEKLKRRTRNGGFIAWPQAKTQARNQRNSQTLGNI